MVLNLYEGECVARQLLRGPALALRSPFHECYSICKVVLPTHSVPFVKLLFKTSCTLHCVKSCIPNQ
eukprot:3075288-Amphidinium_carterae.1